MEVDTSFPSLPAPSQSRFQACHHRQKTTACFFCFVVFCLLPPVLLGLFVLIFRSTLTDSNADWESYLISTPPLIVQSASKINERAETLISNSTSPLAIPYDLDVVISGGGFLSYYWLGVSSVLKNLESRNKTKLHRFAGASAGAQEPFKALSMSGDPNPQKHMETALCYGLIMSKYSSKFDNVLKAAITSDWHWRILGDYIKKNYLDEDPDVLKYLTDKVFISITILNPWSGLIVSDFTSGEQAIQAFIATGSAFVNYQGNLAVDGGATDCAPRFKDGQRSQLIVMLTESGLPMNMVTQFSGVDQAVEAVEKGQDDIVRFLTTGSGRDAFEIVDERSTWGVYGC